VYFPSFLFFSFQVFDRMKCPSVILLQAGWLPATPLPRALGTPAHQAGWPPLNRALSAIAVRPGVDQFYFCELELDA
jgi:hypothetical protein